MNRCAKCDAASFILGGETIQKNTQTVTDISTPCLLESVDNNTVLSNQTTIGRNLIIKAVNGRSMAQCI